MAKIAFLCPGMGSQVAGMGVDFVGRYTWAADMFEDAKAATGLDIFDLCANQTQDELDQTQNAQPCLVTASIVVARALRERGIEPSCVAGMFEGEYAAHVIAGTIDADSALELVARRGALMAMAAHLNKGSIVVLGSCDVTRAQELVSEVHASTGKPLAISAYLDPQTMAVSGDAGALEEFCARWGREGHAAVALPGNVPANCALMRSATAGMARALEGTLFGPGELPVYNNLDGKLFEHAKSPKLLGDQITSPVMWMQTIDAMIDDGVDTFIQCGPGALALDTVQRCAAARDAAVTCIKIASADDVMYTKI